jgi:hypothetical protein
MKINKLEELIRRIVCEHLNALEEDHQRGEWWIDDSGGTIFADIDIGDSGHEGVIIQQLAHEILSHFDVDTDEPGYISEYEDRIKENLIHDDRMSEQDLADWEASSGSRSPYGVILRKLIEDKAYSTPEQAEDALSIAYGSSQRDARDYGMKYLNWKVMKTFGGDIEIQTWHLKPEDLGIIVRGIWDIMEDTDDSDDSDNKVGEDGYPGPRVNVTVQATGKRFHDIPLSVLEKKLPSSLMNYRSGLHSDFREGLAEDYHFHHKEYRMYEGNRNIVAIFEDNSRLKFEVHFRDRRGPDREKWRHKAMTTWKSLANEIHGDIRLSDALNPIQKSWKQSFSEALKHPKMKDFVRVNHHQKIFPDKGYPAKVQGKPQPVMDPVNFTPRR